MCERRFTNHAVRPKTDAIYTTPAGILRLSPIIGLQRYCFLQKNMSANLTYT